MQNSEDLTASAPIGDAKIRLGMFGPLRALTAAGESVLPRGRKAQAILCILALSPEARVPRCRLIQLLWSTRGIEQGRASLRQSLIELRASLAPAAGLGSAIVSADRIQVAMERAALWVDHVDGLETFRTQDLAGLRELPPIGQMLETLQGLDPAFDAWIETARAGLANRIRKCTAKGMAPPIEARQASPSRRLLLSVAPILQLGRAGLDEYTAPALTQELVTALARFRWLGVRFSPEEDTCDYRVEGYLTPGGAGLRLVLRLIDAKDGGVVLWSGEQQTSSPVSSDAMTNLVEAIIAQLDPEILAIETRKALAQPAGSDNAYACVLRGMALLYRFDEEDWREAGEMLARARMLDADYARTFAVSALWRVTGIAQGWSSQPDADLLLAEQEAGRAVGLDPRDSLALALSGHLHAFLHHQFEIARVLFERALAANPSCGFAWGYGALHKAYTGRIREAWTCLERAQAILVHDPFLSFMEGFRAVIAFFAHDWALTIACTHQQLRMRPRFTNMRKLLIGALSHLGEAEEARAEHASLIAQEPEFRWQSHLAAYPFHDPAEREGLRAALAACGLSPGPPPLSAGRSRTRILRPALPFHLQEI